jgi:hypothetical protein
MNTHSATVAAAFFSLAVLAASGCNHAATPSSSSAQNGPQSTANSQPNSAAQNASGQNGGNAAQNAAGGGQNGAPPKPSPAPMPPVTITVVKGASVPFRLDHALSTKTVTEGQTFTGTLYAPLLASSGAVAFPKGTIASGTIVASKNKGRFKGAGVLALKLERIGGQPVSTAEYSVTAKGKGKRTAGMMGGGAGGGAAIGALAGGGTGFLVGTLVGGGAGTAGAVFTGNKPIVIPAEAKLAFKLIAPVTVVLHR